MANTSSMGHQARLSINGVSYPFVSEALAKRGPLAVRTGIRGNRQPDIDDATNATYECGGPIVIEPNMTELQALLALTMGSTSANTANTNVASLNEFTTYINRVGSNFKYTGCKVNRATLSGRQGGHLRLELDIWAKVEAQSGTKPAEPASVNPLLLHHCTFTLGGTGRNTTEFSLGIDNRLERAYYNSQTVTRFNETDSVVTLDTSHPFTSTMNTALYSIGATGCSGILVISNTAAQLTFTFAKLQAGDESPTIANKSEVLLSPSFIARKDGATNTLTVSRP